MASDTVPAPVTTAPPRRPGRLRTLGTSAVRRSVAIAAFLALWEIVPRTGLVDGIFLPPFSRVAVAWWTLLTDGTLWLNLSASLVRSLAGAGLAIVIAVPLGILVGWYKPVADLLNPLLELFRNTAPIAIMPVFVLLLGLGEQSKIALVLFACTWPIILNTVSAVRTVDPLLVKSARSLGFPTYAIFVKVILPSAVPQIFTGVRIAAASAVMVLVAAEMVGAKAGLGFLINTAQYNFEVPEMYAGIVTISLLGLLLNQILVTAERRLSRWRTRA